MTALRQKIIGIYTVRELPMRATMKILDEYPNGGNERGIALLGASVYNGSADPLGLAVGDLGTGIYRALLRAHDEVNSPPADAGELGNG